MKNQIPNIITIISLVLACLAIISVFEGSLALAAYLIILCCVCDFLDGFTARVLKVNNPIGMQIDSIVDMVAFGVAPAMLIYAHIKMAQEMNPSQLLADYPWLIYLVFMIPILSAIRLAKFNIDERQTSSFIGLAVPAHATFYIFTTLLFLFPDWPQIIDVNGFIYPIVSNPIIILVLGTVLPIMLVAEVEMFSLKIKSLGWKENRTVFMFFITWIAMFGLMNVVAMPIIVIIYIVWSYILKFNNNPNPEIV